MARELGDAVRVKQHVLLQYAGERTTQRTFAFFGGHWTGEPGLEENWTNVVADRHTCHAGPCRFDDAGAIGKGNEGQWMIDR